MALTRAQLLMGDSSQGPVLAGQVQAVRAGAGISIDSSGVILIDSQSIIGVMKLGQTSASASAAYNSYEWPTAAGLVGQQITIQSVGGVATLVWSDPDQIPWTLKGQLLVGTGVGTQDLLNVGTDGQILIADSSTVTGLAYTGDYVATTGSTSAANIPAGAPALRPLTPPDGAFRYNSTTTALEFYNGVNWETVASSSTNDFVEKTSDVGIALIPAGSTVQRPAAGLYAGAFRFNTDLDTLEFSDGTNWIQLVMLNNSVGYNSYIWPSADGAYGAFLQTDGVSTLSWSQPAFIGSVAPSPASDGMLWFDCNTGYFKVYQSCVSPVGWTKVAEPGLPVTTANMSALPTFTGGSGTSGSPFIVNTTTVNTGESVLVPNAVTIVGLAPNQYVSIVDLNAAANEGRYHFTNNIADATGTLEFSIVFNDAPASAGGTSYVANIQVGYATGFIQSTINVAIPALTLTSPGSISGTTAAGSTLTYTTGSATGGIPPYTYAWVWKKASDDSVLQTNGATYVIPGSLIGDRVYITLTATDSVSTTASGDTTDYPGAPAVITVVPFPNWAVAAPTTIPGIVSGSWSDGTTSLTSTNCIQISLDGVTFGQGPLSISNGTTLYMQWEPTGASCGGASSGTTITGTLTDGTYENSYSLLLDRNPDAFTFTDLTAQALSTVVSSGVCTIAGTNVNTFLTTTGGTLTVIEASIAGGAFAAIPASGTTMPVQPGQTIQIRGTTGAANSTGYTAILAMGTTTTTWTATTTAPIALITTPSITAPTNGATGLNPAVNTPAGITVTGSAYTPLNGAGATQTSSNWEVFKDGLAPTYQSVNTITAVSVATPPAQTLTIAAANTDGFAVGQSIKGSSSAATGIITAIDGTTVTVSLTSGTFTTSDKLEGNGVAITGSPFTVSAAPFLSVVVLQSALAVSSTYYTRTRYVTTNVTAATSSYSGWSSFATASSFAIPPGTAMAGGYFGGQIQVPAGTGTIYNLIVAPAATGQNTGVQYKTSATGDTNPNSQNEVYGKLATDQFNDAAHPAFQWAKGLNIGGFVDWYIPAKNELEILYYYLKPDTTANNTSSGINPNAVPARGSAYPAGGPPTQTTADGTSGTGNFKSGGAEAFSTAPLYWSSSEVSSNTLNAWAQYFNTGNQPTANKLGNVGFTFFARAIRRIAA